MLVPTLVQVLSAVVVLVGGAAELVDTVRARRSPALVSGRGEREDRPDIADVGRWPLLAWLGLAALTVLGVVMVADRRPAGGELALAVLLLGSAGDRAFYLVRRRSSADGRALGGEALALVVGAIGLLAGFTL